MLSRKKKNSSTFQQGQTKKDTNALLLSCQFDSSFPGSHLEISIRDSDLIFYNSTPKNLYSIRYASKYTNSTQYWYRFFNLYSCQNPFISTQLFHVIQSSLWCPHHTVVTCEYAPTYIRELKYWLNTHAPTHTYTSGVGSRFPLYRSQIKQWSQEATWKHFQMA